MTAIESRITRATHTFHGMSVIHRRRLGVLEATLLNDKIHAELISEGYHGELIWGVKPYTTAKSRLGKVYATLSVRRRPLERSVD